MAYKHIPVLLTEVLSGIELGEGDRVIDCTLGGAGYTLAFSKLVGASGKVYSVDLDNLAIENAQKIIDEKNISNIELIHDSFFNIKLALEEREVYSKFKAIVIDLGLSSAQLDDERRGFSFLWDSSLDMTFGGSGEENNITKDIINWKNEKELERIIREYGEEKYAHRIAKAIAKSRKEKEINTSSELREIIRNAVPGSYTKSGKIHFATRTFQALRIESNNELKGLEKVLPELIDLLESGGKLAIVSFHSLEDRIVKNFFRNESKDCLCPPEIPICQCGHTASLRIMNKKPIEASKEEIKQNPRSRSAKLRIAEKI